MGTKDRDDISTSMESLCSQKKYLLKRWTIIFFLGLDLLATKELLLAVGLEKHI